MSAAMSLGAYLSQRGLRHRRVPGDGSCLYEAIRVSENSIGGTALPLPDAASYRRAVVDFLRTPEAAGWPELIDALQHADDGIPNTLATYADYIAVSDRYGTGIDLMVLSRLRGLRFSWITRPCLESNRDPVELNCGAGTRRIVLVHNGRHDGAAHFDATVRLQSSVEPTEQLPTNTADPLILSDQDMLLQYILLNQAAASKKRGAPAAFEFAPLKQPRTDSEALPSQLELEAMTVVKLKELCAQFKVKRTGTKPQLVQNLLAGPKQDQAQAKSHALFSTGEIQKQYDDLIRIEQRLVQSPANRQTQVHQLLQRVHDGLEEVKSRNIVIGLVGNRGQGKSYIINTLLMDGTSWATCDAVSCHSGSSCDPLVNSCIGHSGPLPSDKLRGSLTALPLRVLLDAKLSVSIKVGDSIKEVMTFDGVTAISMQGVRDFIDTTRQYEAAERSTMMVELRGPFPGLALLEKTVKSQLDASDQQLFNGIEVLDTPGYQDEHFPLMRRRELVRGCDLVLFRLSDPNGRGCNTTDVLKAIQAGALPSYVERATLVSLHNLEVDDKESKLTTFAQCHQAYLDLLRSQFKLLDPSIGEDSDFDQSGESPDHDMSVPQSASAPATDSAVDEDRMLLNEELCDPSKVQVQSLAEAQALFQRASMESALLLFSSGNFRGLTDPTSNINQLAALVVKEVREKARVSRIFPLLDVLQNVGQLIGRRAARFTYHVATVKKKAGAADESYRHRLNDSLMKSPVLPMLRFPKRHSEDMQAIVDAIELVPRNDKPAYFRELRQVLLQSTTLTHFANEASSLLAASFECVLDALDTAVEKEVQKDHFPPGLADHGFFRFVVEDHLKRLMRDQDFKLDFARAVKLSAKETLSQAVQKFRETLRLELRDQSPSDDDETDAEGDDKDDDDSSDDEIKSVVASPDTSSEHRLELVLLVRLILHQALQWASVNATHPRGKDLSKLFVRSQLEAIAAKLREACIDGVEEHLTVPVAPGPAQMPSEPFVTKADAHRLATEADACVKAIRAAMRVFNPSWGPPDAGDRLGSEDPMPRPAPFRNDAMPPRLTAERLDAKKLKYAKGDAFKLNEVTKLLDMNDTIAEEMQACGLLASSKIKMKLPVNKDPNSKLFARHLMHALREQLVEGVAPLEDVNVQVLEAARRVVWCLRPSRLQLELFADEELRSRAAAEDAHIGDHSPPELIVQRGVHQGNQIVHVRRSTVDGQQRLIAHMLPALQERLAEWSEITPDSIAPIIMPTRRCGGDQQSRGNLFLDAFLSRPQESDHLRIQLGLEDRPARIFVVVESRLLLQFLETFGAGSALQKEHANVEIVWVVLPVNFAFFGYAVTIGKLLAESLGLPRYWTIDDDLDCVEQFDNPGRWYKASFRRCLLFGQMVLSNVLDQQYIPLNPEPGALLRNVVEPVHAMIRDRIEGLAMMNQGNFMLMMKIMNAAHQLTSFMSLVADIANTQSGSTFMININPSSCIARVVEEQRRKTSLELEPQFEEILQEALLLLIAQIKMHGRQRADSIASVSISHFRGKKPGYVHKKPRHANYRPSKQRYQCVLHNTDALRGHNMVPDETLLSVKPWHTMTSPPLPHNAHYAEFQAWRRTRISGCKGADRPFTRVLTALGKTGYQVYNFAHHRLRFAEEPSTKNGYDLSQTASQASIEEESEEEEEDD